MNTSQKTQWAGATTFYPDANVTRGFYSATGDAFNATEELKKLQKSCYEAYPDGVIKGYHKGRAKAYNKCMDNASTTINTMMKENTKLKTEGEFNAAVSSALTTGDTGATSNNTMLYAAIAIVLALLGGYVFFSRKSAAPALTPAPVVAAVK